MLFNVISVKQLVNSFGNEAERKSRFVLFYY